MGIKTKHHESITYRLYDELKNHVGKENAISAKDLSAMFGMSKRTLRVHIREIRNSGELEKVIGSYEGGYYVCTKEESDTVTTHLYKHVFNLLKTIRTMDKKAGRDGQMKIKLGEFFKDTYEPFMENDIDDEVPKSGTGV